MTGPQWLSAASQWPVAFAQVREDPRIDLAIADRLPDGSSVLMVASGGCTAACLARHRSVKALSLVDGNAAQMALTRVKIHLLEAREPDERAAILGHDAMEATERSRALRDAMESLELSQEALGPLDRVAALGPDYTGRYEQLFAALQATIRADAMLDGGLGELLASPTVDAQREWLDSHGEWRRSLAAVFEEVLALDHLVTLFGEGATHNPRRSFAAHFLAQFLDLAARLPLARNPFVWQMLRGTFPGQERALWLSLPVGPTEKALACVVGPMEVAMDAEASRGQRHGFIHLSNILDWLDEASAAHTLQAAWDCTALGGWVVIRQLNSTLDIRAIGARVGWVWDGAWSDELLASDRSFFYRELHVGRRP